MSGPDPDVIAHEDDDEDYCALDHGTVEVTDVEAERLFLDACRKAHEAGF